MSLSEKGLHRIMGLMARLPSPPLPETLVRPDLDRPTEQWLNRRGWERAALIRACGGVFLTSLVASLAVCVLTLPLGLFSPFLFLAALVLPFIVPSLSLRIPKGLAWAEERRVMGESPRAVGTISMCVQSHPSLESALTYAAEKGEGVLTDRIGETMWGVLTRRYHDAIEGLLAMLDSLSELNDSLRQSVHLLISATYENTREGMERLLDRANQTILDGVKRATDDYVSSLSVPTLVLFSMGVVLPVMLFALMPLLALGSISPHSAGSSGTLLDPWMLAPLLLVAFPLTSLLYARSIVARNPLGGAASFPIELDRRWLYLLVGWPLAVALSLLPSGSSLSPYLPVLALVIPPSALLAIALRPERGRPGREEVERDFARALFQIGNSMLTGHSLEGALEKGSGERGHFSRFAQRVLYRYKVGREGLETIFGQREHYPVGSPLLEAAMVTVAQCSERDTQMAGKVAMNLARNIDNIRRSDEHLKDRLRGVVEMMRSTAFVFAPLVLGITSSLLELIGDQTSLFSGLGGGLIAMVGVYLALLCLVVTYFTCSISSDGDWRRIGYEFGTRAPLSVILFTIISLMACGGMDLLI